MSREYNKQSPDDDPIREHVFDGIKEYDKKLPNWWLFTLYTTIIFSFIYTLGLHKWDALVKPEDRLQRQRNELAMKSGKDFTDEELWSMSLDKGIVSAGKQIYITNCMSCHGLNLEGGIGQNLIDKEWIHGSNPTDVVRTLTNGVLDKGMPMWGPILGKRKIAEVTAYVMSHHKQP